MASIQADLIKLATAFLKGEGLGTGNEGLEKSIVVLVALVTSIVGKYLYNRFDPFGKNGGGQKVTNKYLTGKSITPVSSGFNWKKQKPRAYRPFRPGQYHMTMGIKALNPDDWLLLEDSYETVTDIRSEIVENHRENTVLTNEMAVDAVNETYDIFVDYMSTKYPRYFYPDRKNPGYTFNAIKKVKIPTTAEQYDLEFKESVPNDKERMDNKIRLLAKNFEEDFLILIFDEETNQYYLRAGSFAFPSGFNPAQKLNTALKDIHGPVPLYKEKIQASMDRFFQKLEVGKWVERYNWSIQAHTNYYAPTLNHAAEGVELKPLNPEELDFNEVFLRCERQVLTRLPNTKHLLFTIRTYLTPLSQLREEEKALDLVDAIDNLPDNVAHYKKRAEWGPAVQAYLRRETDGKSPE